VTPPRGGHRGWPDPSAPPFRTRGHPGPPESSCACVDTRCACSWEHRRLGGTGHRGYSKRGVGDDKHRPGGPATPLAALEKQAEAKTGTSSAIARRQFRADTLTCRFPGQVAAQRGLEVVDIVLRRPAVGRRSPLPLMLSADRCTSPRDSLLRSPLATPGVQLHPVEEFSCAATAHVGRRGSSILLRPL